MTRKLMLIGFVATVALAFIVVTFPTGVSSQNSYTQKPTSGQSKTQMQADKASKTAPNMSDIKSEEAKNNSGSQMPAPAKKRGEKAKGAGAGYVEVTFDNWSPWYVRCYVDNAFRGIVPPWGEMAFPTGSGRTVVFGRANFDDGSSLYWGPREFNFAGGYAYSWRLNE